MEKKEIEHKDNKIKIKEIIKKDWMWIIFAVAVIIFIIIAEDVYKNELMKIDKTAYLLIVEKLRNNILTPIMEVLTNLGGSTILVSITLISLVFVKDKKIGFSILMNLCIIVLLNIIFKNIFQRPRPEGYRLITEKGYSFPSGHSMVNTAFYGLLIYFIYNNVQNKMLKYITCGILSLLIILIGFSRVYLGVHYATDVIAGFLVSISYLICFVKIYNIIDLKNKEKKENDLSNISKQ